MSGAIPAESWKDHAYLGYCIGIIRDALWISPINGDLPSICHLDNVSFVDNLDFSIFSKVNVPELLKGAMRYQEKGRDIALEVLGAKPHDLFILLRFLINELSVRVLMRFSVGIGASANE